MRNVTEDLRKSLLFSFYVGCQLLIVACSGNDYDDSALVGRVGDLENRIEKLEVLCKQMNTNISSLQVLVTALQNNDYITGVIPVKQGAEILGYTISFAKSESIMIFNGRDGTDGEDGNDGKDGVTPLIGVKQDIDGIFYWTLNGEWLKDEAGNKIQTQGTNGVDGEDGTNGKDGKDAVTPLLKIENAYWYVSYDNGSSWKQLGKAIKDDNGIFKDVIVAKDKVTFILYDGMMFQISMFSSLSEITIEVKEEGMLGNILTKEQKQNVTFLKITGNLNKSDLRTIYSLHYLEKLDLSDTNGAYEFGNELFPNTCIKEVVYSKSYKGDNCIYLHDMYSLEKLVVFTDSLFIHLNRTPAINTLTYSEGVRVIPKSESLSGMLYIFKEIIFPATLKRLSGTTLRKLRSEVNIVCNAAVPPIIGDWVSHRVTSGMKEWWETTYEPIDDNYMTELLPSYTVVVPKGCTDLYRKSNGWRKMKIVESK